MKVILLGASGQLGRSIVSHCQELNLNWDIITPSSLDLNITSREDVVSFVRHKEPDVVINAAAYTRVDDAERNIQQAYLVNRDGAKYVAEASCLVGAFLIHFSTDYVFSGDGMSPYEEDDVTGPKNIYGSSKLAGEELIAKNCQDYVILRTSWVFSVFGENFVKTMLRLGRDQSSLNVIADQVGGPTYASDLADCVISIIKTLSVEKRRLSGIYHFSGLHYVSWLEFANTIFSEAIKAGRIDKAPNLNPVTSNDYSSAANRPKNSRLCCRKVYETFKITPSCWEVGLKKVVSDIDFDAS